MYNNAKYDILKKNKRLIPIFSFNSRFINYYFNGRVLISFQRNIKNYAILSLYGQRKRQIIISIIFAYLVILILSYFLGCIAYKINTSTEPIPDPITYEGYIATGIVFSIILIINCIIISAVFHRSPLSIYIENK